MAVMSLGWLKTRLGILSILIGCRNIEEVHLNVPAFKYIPDMALNEKFSELTEVQLPHDFLTQFQSSLFKSLGQEVKSISAARELENMRGMLSIKPPPVMCANPFTRLKSGDMDFTYILVGAISWSIKGSCDFKGCFLSISRMSE